MIMSEKTTTPKKLQPPRYTTRIATFLRKSSNNRNVVIGATLLLPVVIISILAPIIATHDPASNNYAATFATPSVEYLFGTDQYGRDLFSRTIYGGRTSLYIGFASVLLAAGIGVPTGVSAGYYSGMYDELVMRAMDILMTFPPIVLALLLLVTVTPSMNAAVVAIGIVFAPRIARVARASTLSVADEDYIKACEQRGESSLYIMAVEILPNIRGPIVIESTIRVGYAIIIGAALSFLGLGVQPPTPDWGVMIADARNELHNSIWMLLFPTVSLSATILGVNLLGDGLGDVLDDESGEFDNE